MSLSAIILSLLTVFSVGTKTEIYAKPCTVEVVEEWVEVSDDNGNGWVFENSGIYNIGDNCIMIVDERLKMNLMTLSLPLSIKMEIKTKLLLRFLMW